jgi:hypothetical protein
MCFTTLNGKRGPVFTKGIFLMQVANLRYEPHRSNGLGKMADDINEQILP